MRNQSMRIRKRKRFTGLRRIHIFNPAAKHVFWRIDRKKRLIFFGHGCIPGYAPGAEYFAEPPWKGLFFKQVVIGRGIRDVHPTALLGVDLDHVILKNEGKRKDGLVITESGLYNQFTKELLIGRDKEKVNIDEGTVDINPFAFAFHENVKEIECPSSLERIGVSAFEGCTKLKSMYRVPASAIIGARALKGTSGVSVYYDKNHVKIKIHQMHPKTAITNFGRAFLMNGKFVFFASDKEKNIDPTKFYRCKDLIDIKGGDDFLIGLRSNGDVIYEKVDDFSGAFDYYSEPFRFKQYSSFDRLKSWKDIQEIEVVGNVAVGLCENGMVYSTLSDDVDQPVEGLSDVIALELKNQRIYAVRSDWSLVQINKKRNFEEEEAF